MIFSSKIDELLHRFDANFEEMVQKIVTSGNCLQFPKIPTKISENFTEKSAIPMKFLFFFFSPRTRLEGKSEKTKIGFAED